MLKKITEAPHGHKSAYFQNLRLAYQVEILTQILEGLNAVDSEIEKAWAKEGRRRLDDFEQGRTEAIPGDQVMKELRRIAGK